MLSSVNFDEAVRGFFRERLEFYLRDVRGFAYDVVNAVLAADADDVVDALARAEAVSKVRPSADFDSISVSFKRMKNILRQAREAGREVAPEDQSGLVAGTRLKKIWRHRFRRLPRGSRRCAPITTTNRLCWKLGSCGPPSTISSTR